jgi:hypothetical protein
MNRLGDIPHVTLVGSTLTVAGDALSISIDSHSWHDTNYLPKKIHSDDTSMTYQRTFLTTLRIFETSMQKIYWKSTMKIA